MRKPLLLKGVRQVGKTWLLNEFGRTAYEHTAYFNFDENPEYREFFQTTKDVHRIIPNLAMASAQVIMPENTLIVFDEIQEAPEALNALKYFHETAPEYHVACAGSLLGIALARPSSFPVGQVEFLQVRPLTFTEFLLASGKENLVSYLEGIDHFAPIPAPFFNPSYEVDFIIQRENDIFPVEVKAEDNVHSTSLRKYAETFPDQTKMRLRFSLANLHRDDELLNIPLFLIDQADRLIGLALCKQ